MSRKNKITLDFSGIEQLVRKLDAIGADCDKIGLEVLQEAAEKVQADTRAALAPANLPAAGNYATGKTAEAVIEPRAEKTPAGLVAPVGFDKTKRGAGGYLIGGTPSMRPDPALHRMFAEPGYMKKIVKGMEEAMLRFYGEAMK